MGELFSNLGIDGRLLFAQAVNFFLVLWLLNRFVFRKLLSLLEERRKKIEQGLELRNRAEKEVAQIGEARHRALQEVKREAEVVLSQTRDLARQKEQELLKAAKEQQDAILLRAQEQGKKAKEDMLNEAQQEIRMRALFLAEQALGRTLTPKDEERIAKEVVQALQHYAK
jgi:F-type H+-transporting ATPase subunit b